MEDPEGFFQKQIETAADEKKLITYINTKLERVTTRIQGMKLITKFCSKISKENLPKFFPLWMSTSIQILTKAQTNSLDLVVVCKSIASIIDACKQVPELEKQISISTVKQLIGILTETHHQDKSGAIIHLLAIMLYHYPESSARFQVSLGKLISIFFGHNQRHLVEGAAKCYALLVRAVERSFIQASPKNNSIILPENSTTPTCYIFHQIHLCNSLHTIMNQLFRDIVISEAQNPYEIHDMKGINVLQLNEISFQDLSEYYTATEQRFTNFCIFLSTLLLAGGKNGFNYTLPSEIFRLVCHGLSITPKNLKNSEDNKKVFLLNILPKLHIGLMKVLKAFIESFQEQVIPHAIVVQTLILQILDWTSEISENAHLEVRNFAYEILSVWLNINGSVSGFHLIADDFLYHFTKDISPIDTNIVSLNTTKQCTLNNTKDSKKAQNINGSNIRANISEYNTTSRSSALIALQAIFSNSSNYLRNTFYENIRNVIISQLYQTYIKQNSAYSGSTNCKSRLLLLKTLRFLQTYPHYSSVTPTQYAIQIFGLALSQESDVNIKEEAKLGLAEAHLIVHPSSPSLMVNKHVPQAPQARSSSASPKPFESPSYSSRSRSMSQSPPCNEIQNSNSHLHERRKISIDETPNDNSKRPRIGQETPPVQTTTENNTNIELPTPSAKTSAIVDSPDVNAIEPESDELLLTFCDVLPDSAPEDELLNDSTMTDFGL